MTGRGVLTMLAGAAGAGKTTAVRRMFPPDACYGRDWARGVVAGNSNDQSDAAAADAATLISVIAGARLRRGLPVVIDSTGTSASFVPAMQHLGRVHGASVELLIVDTPLQVCIDRNRRRPGPQPGERWGRAVPEPEIRKLHAAVQRLLDQHQTGTLTGWDQVTVVSGEQ